MQHLKGRKVRARASSDGGGIEGTQQRQPVRHPDRQPTAVRLTSFLADFRDCFPPPPTFARAASAPHDKPCTQQAPPGCCCRQATPPPVISPFHWTGELLCECWGNGNGNRANGRAPIMDCGGAGVRQGRLHALLGECDEWAGLFGLKAGDGLFLTVSDDLGFSSPTPNAPCGKSLCLAPHLTSCREEAIPAILSDSE